MNVCPECVSGKHVNCTVEMLDSNDQITDCACHVHGHQEVTIIAVPLDADNITMECSICHIVGTFSAANYARRVTDHLTLHGADPEHAVITPLGEQ